jgi:hypothetical protein
MTALFVNGTFDPQSDFEPIRELRQENADVTLVFLSSNQIAFLEQTTDEWYRATNSSAEGGLAISDERQAVYSQDEIASPLACVAQYQVCSPAIPDRGNGHCTPLSSFYHTHRQYVYNPYELLVADANELSRIQWIWSIASKSQLPMLISSLRAQVLTSRNSFWGIFQGPLAPNQWQLEVEHWFAAMLARTQLLFTLTATGINDPVIVTNFTAPPLVPQEDVLCKSQVWFDSWSLRPNIRFLHVHIQDSSLSSIFKPSPLSSHLTLYRVKTRAVILSNLSP